jgi:hypothetical protein
MVMIVQRAPRRQQPPRKRRQLVQLGRVAKRQARPRRRFRGGQMGMGDAAGYRRLLVDPCNAELVKSPYYGSMGGVVQRAVGLAQNAALYTAYAYHPAYGYFTLSAPDSVTPASFTYVASTGPQGGFVCRGIAGCVEAAFIAAESTRQGSVACGVIPGGILHSVMDAPSGGQAGTISFAQLMSKLSTNERMPVDRCSANWFPAIGDEEFNPNSYPSASQAQALEVLLGRTNFVVVAIANAPIASVQTKFVGVYESNLSVSTYAYASWTAPAPQPPAFDWKKVVGALGLSDPDWYLNTFMKVGKLAGGALMGYATGGLPGALGYLTQSIAGLPLRGRSRAVTS